MKVMSSMVVNFLKKFLFSSVGGSWSPSCAGRAWRTESCRHLALGVTYFPRWRWALRWQEGLLLASIALSSLVGVLQHLVCLVGTASCCLVKGTRFRSWGF